MNKLTVLFYTIFLNIITIPGEYAIIDFFDISFSSYGIYSFWVRALTVFNAFLPVTQKNLFY